jgi:hypothetical protein
MTSPPTLIRVSPAAVRTRHPPQPSIAQQRTVQRVSDGRIQIPEAAHPKATAVKHRYNTMLFLKFKSSRATWTIGPAESGAYAFAGRERIAKLNPLTGLWNQTGTQQHWPGMRVIPATG